MFTWKAKRTDFMRPFLLLTIALTVTGIVTAANAAPQERWEGYRTADSAEVQNLNLPFQDFAENAVLEMETIGLTMTAGERFEEVNVNNEPVITDPQILSSNLRLMQIETCRKQDLQVCPVLSYSNRGTTFFNRGRFVACRHNFHNWLSLASQLNGNRSVRSISPPMILRNSKGDIVYNSAQYTDSPNPAEKPQMTFSTINDDPRLNFQTHKPSFPSKEVRRAVSASDYVEFTLSERIVNDYAITERTLGDRNLRRNEETYLFGYPEQTKSFPNRIGDTPGRILVFSNGLANAPNSSFLHTSNYANAGMSGAPVVTGTGELAGVHCRGTSSPDPAIVDSYSLPIGSAFARNYWSTIDYPTDTELAALEATQSTSVSQ
jgi:hypothetical protein